MGIIGSAVGGAMKIGGAIFGGISAAKKMKQVKANIDQQRKDNQAWFDRRYNEDATQRADAQAVINMTTQNILERNRQAAGAQAVMGGTEESLAAAKAANNQALAQTMSGIAVNAEQRKDSIESQFLERDSALQNQKNQTTIQEAENIKEAASQVGQTASETLKGMPF